MREKISLEEIIESTRQEFIKCGIKAKNAGELDLSYITQELIDLYDKEAKNKDSESSDTKNVATRPWYWGNNWVHRPELGKWQYRNSNYNSGIDENIHLCGTQYIWRVEFKNFKRFDQEYDCIGYWGKSAWATWQNV